MTRSSNRLSPEFVLLGFLYGHPAHGYLLHQQLMEVFGHIWHASQSQTYNILKRLDSQGYINSKAVSQVKLPPRQRLNITDLGKKRFESWLKQPTKSSVHAIRVEFITRLYFTQLYFPQDTQKMIRAQVEVVEAGLDALQKGLDNLSAQQTFDRLALGLRVKLLKSVVSWLNGCQQAFSAEEAEAVAHG